MTHTLNNSMAGFIPECNILLMEGIFLSEYPGAILLSSSSILIHFFSLIRSSFSTRESCKGRNSNFSLMSQQIFKVSLGYSSQADQDYLAKDAILCQYFQGISSQSSVSRFLQPCLRGPPINAFWRRFHGSGLQDL